MFMTASPIQLHKRTTILRRRLLKVEIPPEAKVSAEINILPDMRTDCSNFGSGCIAFESKM